MIVWSLAVIQMMTMMVICHRWLANWISHAIIHPGMQLRTFITKFTTNLQQHLTGNSPKLQKHLPGNFSKLQQHLFGKSPKTQQHLTVSFKFHTHKHTHDMRCLLNYSAPLKMCQIVFSIHNIYSFRLHTINTSL